MSKTHLFVYRGPPGRLETVRHFDGTVTVCLVDDGGRTERCIKSLDLLTMNASLGKILIDPKVHYSEIIQDSKRMPEMVLNATVATMNHIWNLSKYKEKVTVRLLGRSESEYPRKWFQPLLDELVEQQFSVETVDDLNR